ncbi:MAG TPA: dephospho-CoA kinase [Bryobacteraceae bacterium]|jgi:dephospho-CoA kinase|nr:dephospho-CoA kinase [Bryobacteraceae bacterium]
MLTVGLTGGMACGKTHVARELRRLGCYILEADEIGHEVMMPGHAAYEAIVAAFGAGILNQDGSIDRAALAARVFGKPAELETLNAIVHPAVHEEEIRRIKEISSRDPHAIIIHVAAILIESGAYKNVDKIIVVTCSREQQIERALHRARTSGANVNEAAIVARLENQMPLEKKKALADYVIDASGVEAETLRQTKIVWEDLKRQV